MASVDNTAGDLTRFKALSFDCYGTLIEWEPGLTAALRPITDRLPREHAYAADPRLALQRLDALSAALEAAQPTLRYDLNLATATRQLAAELGVAPSADTDAAADAMGAAPGAWPAFADTLAALRVLQRHYKLVLLSNVDNANIARTTAGALAGVRFDAVYTAEDIGSYKPAARNFEYLFRRVGADLGVDAGRGELLHVAHSLRVDHSAAKRMGFESAWISRGGERPEARGIGGDYERMMRDGECSFQWRFETMGDFAREVARQFGDEYEVVG